MLTTVTTVADQYIGSVSDEAAGDIAGAAATLQPDEEHDEFNEMVQVQVDILFGDNNQHYSDDLLDMYYHEYSEDWMNASAVLAGEYNSSNINCPAHINPSLAGILMTLTRAHHLHHHHQDHLHRYHQPQQYYHLNLQPREPSTVSIFRPAAASYIITHTIYSCS
jgi:hypothetical protein